MSQATPPPSFAQTLAAHGLGLSRGRTQALQVNVGALCNLACRHCHLEAGPARREVMDPATMRQVADFARKANFALADITGGAPELTPGVAGLVEDLAGLVPRLIFRTNLLAMEGDVRRELLETLLAHRVNLVASLPSTSASQAEAQRGAGAFARSMAMLRRLNELGYGLEGSGLGLDLVSNPTGAFLPPAQAAAEARFRAELGRRHGVVFHHVYTFANAPLGRFRRWLESTGNLEPYQRKLAEGFNPCTLPGLMCRTQVSVAWDGRLYDCDFNLAAGLPLAGAARHVAELDGPPAEGTPIAVGDHCFACTAGAGFT
jgi:radical SAM/Cys-rich protein